MFGPFGNDEADNHRIVNWRVVVFIAVFSCVQLESSYPFDTRTQSNGVYIVCDEHYNIVHQLQPIFMITGQKEFKLVELSKVDQYRLISECGICIDNSIHLNNKCAVTAPTPLNTWTKYLNS